MASSDPPRWRIVQPPVTAAMLGALEPGCQAVTLRTRLTDAGFDRLSESMRPRPDVNLYVSQCHDDTITDLEFLRYFRWLGRFSANVASLRSLDGVRHLTGVRRLTIGAARRPLSVAPLASLPALRHLSLEGPVKDAGALSALTGLRSLTLRSITLGDLSLLVPITGLRALDVKLGGTRDLGPLPAFTELECLELWMIRGFSDLSPVSDMPSLDTLFLQALKHVTQLPPSARWPGSAAFTLRT